VKMNLCRAGGMLATMFLATSMGFAGGGGRNTFVLTSTNNANGNEVVVFELDTAGRLRYPGKEHCQRVGMAAPAPTLEFYSSATISELWQTTDPIRSAK